MKRTPVPVEQYYYAESEWARLGCGPLPPERTRNLFLEQFAQGNPKVDGKHVKGSN